MGRRDPRSAASAARVREHVFQRPHSKAQKSARAYISLMGCSYLRTAADACDRSQGVHTVAAAEHCGGLDDVAWQALAGEAAGEGGRQGAPAMATHVSSSGVGKVGGALANDEQDEGCGEQSGAALAATGAVAGLHRVERACITAATDGAGSRQDHEEVDQSGIEPGHVEVDGVR